MLVNVIRAIPPQAVPFIKAHEGCVLKVYADPVGVLTCGYGHTAPGLQLGAPITQEQADAFLGQDLQTAGARLEAQVGDDIIQCLTDNQYSALLSFVFNLGTGPKPKAVGEWHIWGLLRARQFISAADELTRFDKAGGRVLAGLVQRRADEKVLYMTGAPQAVDDTPPSSVTRSIPTPPTQAYVKALGKSKAWLASCVSTCVAMASAAAPQVKDGADSVNRVIAPYVGQSTVLQAVSQHLALVGAAAAASVLVFQYFQHRAAKSQ